MSLPFRNQIKSLYPEITEILEANKTFPVPLRNQGQSDHIYFSQIRAYIRELDFTLSEASDNLTDLSTTHDQWMDLRAKMTGTERTHDNDVYDEFTKTCPYPSLIGKLKKYVRSLTAQKNELTAILNGNNSCTPPPTANTASTSLAHLPRMALPQFSGNCVEFPSFWSSFQAAVGDLPNISDSVKLSYLKSCLRSAPLAVIESFPLVDQSYPQAVDLLKQKYENPTEISRSLCQSLKQLPTVRKGENFCRDLSSLVNEFESLICRFTQQGENTDNIHIQLEIESKLPTFVLEEIYKAKEENPAWTTELLKQKLKAILKRKEDISAMNNSPPKPQVKISPLNLCPPRNDSPPLPQSSLTFHTQTMRKFPPREPKLPCLFCNVFGHFSPSCQQYPDLYSRRNKLRELRRCFSCMKEGHKSPQCRVPMKCSSCGGPHPRALCSHLLSSKPQFTPRPPQQPPQTYRNTGDENPRLFHPTRLPHFTQPQPSFNAQFAQSRPDTRLTEQPQPPSSPTISNPNQQTFCSQLIAPPVNHNVLPITKNLNVKWKQRSTTPKPKALREGLTKMPATKMEFNPRPIKVKIKPKLINSPPIFPCTTFPNWYGGSCFECSLAYVPMHRLPGPIPLSCLNFVRRNPPTPLNMINVNRNNHDAPCCSHHHHSH
uniref:CCHC-type domain-containing protein n=1 Tax=Meloidogyne incognita TaxID=6306 RepID=A0A914LGU4_MELIC